MVPRITGRTLAEEGRDPTINVALKARDRRFSWLGRVLRMPASRLVRRVLLNCVKSTKEELFAHVPNPNIDYAIKISEERELWRSSRPSLRCQPLLGGSCNKVRSSDKYFRPKARIFSIKSLCFLFGIIFSRSASNDAFSEKCALHFSRIFSLLQK